MAMRTVSSITAMQRLAKQWQRGGIKIGFVPTMGYLHAGHLSLVKRARQLVGSRGKVVVSIYVNPTQFGPTEDFSRYPRDLKRDLKLCREAGSDVVFTPGDAEMYPRQGEAADEPARENARPTSFSTYVVEEKLSQGMEGASRPTHFKGVTTVVAKLFNIVLPDVAVFGQKDFQQAAIIKRMTSDLNFPLKIVVAPTLREPDGLAMSSRNKYLAPEQRRQATILYRSLEHARSLVRGKTIAVAKLKTELAKFIAKENLARLDYVEVFDPETLAPLKQAAPGAHMALAVFFGKTRLIDNGRL
jgi:pantoate--beta-alanine ligase